MKQIAVNLLDNVANYSQAAKIHLTSWTEADIALSTVCHDGMGIAAKNRLSIF